MARERDREVRTVLRGETLRQQLADSDTVQRAPAAAIAPRPGADSGQVRLINGVPASAAVHCCGRGCPHCRIYWRKSDG